MADTITRTFLTLAGLTHYDEKIKAFIANADLTVMNAVSAAQAEIDALEKLVGTLPEGTTAKDVVEYVNLKTTGIATTDALTQLQTALEACQAAVDAIEADYLKAADKTELSNAITSEADRAKAKEDELDKAIKAEVERATGIEGGLETRLAAVEADYLVEADKTELSNAINTEKERAMAAEKVNSDAIAILNGSATQAGSVAKQVADAVAGILDGAPEAYDTLNEIATWIAAHPESVAAINAEIKANSDAIDALEKLVGVLPEGETSADVVAYIQKLVAAEETRATGVESGHAARIEALETAVGTSGGKSVAEQIEAAVEVVQGEVDALEEVVGTKAAQADLEAAQGDIEQLQTDVATAQTTADQGVADAAAALKAAQDASAHADSLNSAMDTRVKAVEATSHTHDNKTVIDGITAEKVAAWDAAEGNAKSHANGLNTAMDARMVVVEGKASANESAISTLSSTHATDKAALESSIATLEASFVEITNSEIDGLFA